MKTSMIMHRGFVHEPLRAPDLSLGSWKSWPVVRDDAQWDDDLPKYEPQRKGIESMACVSFSALNVLETQHKAKYGTEKNWSDRFLAVMSGTTRSGNTFSNVLRSIQRDGLVDQAVWPFIDLWDKFYEEPPQEIKDLGLQFFKQYEVSHVFAPTDAESMYEMLRRSPLQTSIRAYGELKNGIYQRIQGYPTHALMVYGGDYGKYFKAYDHYDNKYKKLAWNTLFWGALAFDINRLMKFQNNTLIQLNSHPGGFYMFLDGKLLKIETVDHSLAWLTRAGQNFHALQKVATRDELSGIPVYDFKGGKIADSL